ncbi:MAG TPA: hypothetical protein VEZ90_02260 [Blastocatellia bacterium]|nr:hypothetical protein [Blastocatellia bacterium]
MHALISPTPGFAGKLENGNITSGERTGTFSVWPTAHPAVKLQRGDRFSFSLKVTTGELDSRIVNQIAQPADRAAAKAPEPGAVAPASGATAPQVETDLQDKNISYRVRREGSLSNYWIDFDINAPESAGVYKRVVALSQPPVLTSLCIELKVTVLDKSLIVVPTSLDVGEISIQALRTGEIELGRVGVRTEEGEFHIKSLASTIPFIRVVAQPIFAGKNYLLHVQASGDASLRPGTYEGTLNIETDDKLAPHSEVSLKITLIP